MAQQTFEELVDAVMQAESRGKRYKDDGKTLTTSSKGALGEMQVMPKTIKDPGFGVTPARDKSADEIARVGVDYLQAMKQKYGDTEKALIAYNWGPGSTDKWIASGADPKKLPAETRTYVERVKGFLGGKDVPRETSVAKKEREPLPPSLPPMAQAPSVKPEAAARVASLGPGYQAALALSFLAETDDEEDRKTTITQEYLAKAQEEEDDIAASTAIAKRQANVFADLSNTTIRSPFDNPQQPVMMKDGGDVSAEDLTKPSFGNPNIRKQGEAARRLAAMRDVNTLPDPKTYAAVAGALGTRPDQMGFSVLNPKYKEIMDVANPAFYAGTALQIAPVAQGPGMGRMVGAAERALEPAVRRTLEGGGKASEMLQALAAPPSQMFVRARPEAAARHADLQAQGLSPEQIRAQNLTLVDNRGNLLEEISDAPAVLQQKTASVPRMYYDMLKHPELQSIYPAYDMPDVRIGTTRRKDAPLAAASFGEKEGIQGTVRSLPGDDVRGTVRGTLLHEGQHAIQSIEGFTEGANPSSFVAYVKAKRGIYDADPTVNENVIREMERVYPNLSDITDRIGQDLKARYGKVFPSDKRMGEALYRHMPGEVQAELARVRSNLTPEELKATPLEVSMQQLNINPANILEMNKQGRRLDRQIGDLEYDVYGYAQGGPVYRANGSPEEGERLTGINKAIDFVAQKVNSKVLPTSARTFLETVQGTRTPITEVNFSPEELNAMRQLIELTGDRGNVQYDDYTAFMRKQQKEKGTIPASIAPNVLSVLDPIGNVQTTLGRFSYSRDPNGNLVIVDKYDFNPIQNMSGAYGALRNYATKKIPPGKGRDVRINLGQPVNRAKGGDAEPTAEEIEAASTPAFIAQKSGIGRKQGNISKALQSGQGQIEFLKGLTNVPQNIVGAPMDISNMIANVYGGGVEKPFMGSEYIKEKLRAQGLGFTPSTDPTLAGFYAAGDLGSNLVNPAGATRAGVKAAGKTGEAAKMLANNFQVYNQQLNVPGASYAIRNRGTPFIMRPEQITTGGRIIPEMNEADAKADYLARMVDTGANLRTDNPALANWFRSKVGAYLRRDFGTEQDQMVQAADKGMKMHFTSPRFLEDNPYVLSRDIGLERQTEMFPKEGYAKTPQGQEAEAIIDSSIYPLQLQDISKNRIPKNMRQFIDTNPEMRLSEMGSYVDENLKLELLANKMNDMFKETVFRAYGEQVPMPKDYILTEDTLKGLTPAQASNRVARKQEWVTEKRGELAGVAIAKDPRIVSHSYDNGSKWISPADLAENPKHEEMVKDIGCAGGWCTERTLGAIEAGIVPFSFCCFRINAV